MNNYEKYQQIKKEAGATGFLLLALILFWLAAGFGLADVKIEILHLPLWVWASSIGVWLFAIAGVRILTRTVFCDMPLDDEEVSRHGK